MYVSMWMLAQALKGNVERLEIRTGAQSIRGARFLAQVDLPEQDIVYIGPSNEYIDGCASNEVLCICQNDSFLLTDITQLEIFNRLLDTFDLYQRWQEDVAFGVANDKTLSEMLLRSSHLLPEGLMVVERGGRVCCSMDGIMDTKLFYKSSDHPYMYSSQMELLDRYGARQAGGGAFLIPELKLAAVDLYDKSFRVGMLLAETGEIYNQCLLQLLEQVGKGLEQWMSQHPDRESLQCDSSALTQLLAPKPESACVHDFSQYLERMGWKTEDTLTLHLVLPARETRQKRNVQVIAAALPGTIVTTFERYILILENNRLARQTFASHSLSDMARRERWRVGSSYPFRELGNLFESYQQAKMAIEEDCAEGTIRSCADFQLQYICSLVRKQTTASLFHPALGILEAYDRKNGTQLLETLAAWLIYERRQKETAVVLNVHRNSVFYRLNQIQSLCELDLEDPQTRLQLLMSFLLRGDGKYPGLKSEGEVLHKTENMR